jgi:hypothetical protein
MCFKKVRKSCDWVIDLGYVWDYGNSWD